MWWLAAAAAAPVIMNMLMPKPDTPQYAQAQSAMNPELQGYQHRELEAAFNPNSSSYNMAADNATNQVNTNLARLGLSRSSYGIAANQDAQAQIARNWQQDSFARQNQAINNVNQSVGEQNRVNQFNVGQQNNSANAAYNAAMMNRQNTIGGMSSMANTAAMMYGMRNGSSPGGGSPMPPGGGYDPNVMNGSMYGGMNPYSDVSGGYTMPDMSYSNGGGYGLGMQY